MARIHSPLMSIITPHSAHHRFVLVFLTYSSLPPAASRARARVAFASSR